MVFARSRGLLMCPLPSNFLSLYSGKQVIMRTDGYTDHVMDFLVCNVPGVRDAKESSVASHFHVFIVCIISTNDR